MKTRIEDAAREYCINNPIEHMDETLNIRGKTISYEPKENSIEAFIAGAEFMQEEFDLVKHQLDYAEKILTEVQADKFKLKVQNEVMRETLEHLTNRDMLLKFIADREAVAIEDLKKIGEV